VVGRRARERKAERDIYRAAERCDLDGRHPDVGVRRDHGVKFPAHRAHEDGVRRERAFDSGLARCRLQKLRVLTAEPSAVAGVRIEGAQRNSRCLDSEPRLKPIARDARCFDDGRRAQSLGDAAKGNVGRRQHNAELVRREHHRNAGSSQRSQHLGVAGKVVSAREQRCLVDGSGHNPIDFSRLRHLHSALDREAAEHSCQRRVRFGPPLADRLGHLDSGAVGPYDHNVTALADP